MGNGCKGCGRGLPYNGGEWVGTRELCPRCAARGKAKVRAERRALEEMGQQTCFTDEVPVVLPALGGLFGE